MIPVAKGGETVPSNLLPAHRKCNEEKGTLTIKEWYLIHNYRKAQTMQPIQYNIPELDEEMAKIQSKEIGEEATRRHLLNQYKKYEKYQDFSKDPKFKERMKIQGMKLALMIGKVGYER
jgi:hypothetical protein